MHSTQRLLRRKNLLLVFDAFGTLYQPNSPIPTQYGKIGLRHGVDCQRGDDTGPLKNSFKRAFGEESAANPNYGKATGLGAEKWWANVITNTYQPFLNFGQEVPQALISELLTRYSTSEGYDMYPDVKPLFSMLRSKGAQASIQPPWRWEKTVVGIITNSDDRVPGILESFGLKVGSRRVGSGAQRIASASVDDDISFVVLSYDVGFEKPDRRIFDAATEMLRETLAESGEKAEKQDVDEFEKLYVGDSIEKDYLGAKRAGWDALVVDRQGTHQDDEATKQVDVIRNLGALSRWSPR
ncbi:HAD-like protein [Melanomma pulvis-pyrius CBS 109.77]|uniref:HAD-like protein n=1 Tax=Melanomma pulvis-pyrius CBS 109.77 TaxID=1314802 RepID=A0A6A6X4Q8_9PLEO|nr:HAD-like protein [Melanomma pulvis-pyrius CBS 109.77]